jgi:hypothetical protein
VKQGYRLIIAGKAGVLVEQGAEKVRRLCSRIAQRRYLGIGKGWPECRND